MVINFNPKYIPGDIVYNHKKEIIRITSSYLKVLNYSIIEMENVVGLERML